LKLNLVALRGSAKTIAMEKEVFDCFNAQSTLEQIKDVETFIELVAGAGHDRKKDSSGRHESNGQPSPSAAALSVSTVTCSKSLIDGRVACSTGAVPIGVTQAPLAGCSMTRGTYPFAAVEQPTHPVEMSSVVVGEAVKTVKVEKEVFDCAGRVADLYLFTNRVETASHGSFGPAKTTFTGVVCFKNEGKAQITDCKVFNP
jgi:hypothetical protein